LSWIPAGEHWTGTAGSAPSNFSGSVGQNVGLNSNGRFPAGGGDEDFDVGSSGTTHFADLIFIQSKGGTQLGVAETNCPAGATAKTSWSEQVSTSPEPIGGGSRRTAATSGCRTTTPATAPSSV
jgi:hypothetical protein